MFAALSLSLIPQKLEHNIFSHQQFQLKSCFISIRIETYENCIDWIKGLNEWGGGYSQLSFTSSHRPKSNPNFRGITRNVEENEILQYSTWNIPAYRISFSPPHFILYRGKSITFGTVHPTIPLFYRGLRYCSLYLPRVVIFFTIKK